MKKNILYKLYSFAVVYFSITGFLCAQAGANVVFSAENGELLKITIDGQLVNPEPQGQVRADNLAPGAHKATVFLKRAWFEASIKETLYLEGGNEYYYNVKQNRKDEYVVRLYNVAPFGPPPGPAPNPNPNPNPYPPNPNPNPYPPGPVPMSPDAFQAAMQTINNQAFDSNKLTVARQITSVNFLTSAQVGEVVRLFSFESSKLEYAKYAYIFTYDPNNYFLINDAFQFAGSVNELNAYIQSLPPRPNPGPPPGQINPSGGCFAPMNPDAFQAAMGTLNNQSFDSNKLTVARQIVSVNCLSAAQVGEMMRTFSFEGSKLEFAKFAYNYTFDFNNYFIINNGFQFSSSVDQLNAYIQSLPPRPVPGPPPGPPPGPRPGPSPRPSDSHHHGRPSPNSSVYNANNTDGGNGGGNGSSNAAHNGARVAMEAGAFQQALNAIKGKNSDYARLDVARQVIADNYLTASNVRDMLKTFNSEINRLTFAKEAYTKTVDPNNYFLVNETFNSTTNVHQLKEYIEQVKKK